MAEEKPDPRDVPWHPRRRFALHGHGDAEARLLRGFQSGKLHHAWLISGPRGIGKATFAYRLARFLLSKTKPGAPSLDVPEALPVSRQIAAGAHPDLFVLERAFDGKKIKNEIAVDDSRKAGEFLAQTAGAGGWRVVIVDSTDDLNGASANALLKLIEEPPSQAIFLLISHRPGALLRTIRSRAVDLVLQPLELDDTLRVLDEIGASGKSADELKQAAELSQGSPGRAFDLIGSTGAKVFASFKANPVLTQARCIELAAPFGGRDTVEDYEVFTALLVAWIGGRARALAQAGVGAELAKAHDDIVYSLRQTDALNLDRRQTVTDALLALGEALKAS